MRKAHPRAWRALLSVLLSAALAVLSAGLAPYQAAAGILEGPSEPARAPETPQIAQLALPVSGSLSRLEGVGQPAAAQASALQAPAAGALQPLQAASSPKAQTALAAVARRLTQARADGRGGSVGGVLTRLFDRSSSRAPVSSLVSSGGDPEGPSSDGTLARLSVSQLEAVASDLSRPQADRRSALKAIAGSSDRPAAQAALDRAAAANAAGGAADYEVHRYALRLLAGLGIRKSLLPVSESYARAILDQLRRQKPEAAAFDLDGTLLDAGEGAIDPAVGALLARGAQAATEVMLLTGRSDTSSNAAALTAFDALSSLTPAQKANLSLGADSGARVYLFDRQGRARLVEKQPVWTEGERAVLSAALRDVGLRFGLDSAAPDYSGYRFTGFLNRSLTADQVSEAAARMQRTLAELKLPLTVSARMGFGGDRRPSLSVWKYDKARGMTALRSYASSFLRLRDAFRYLPAWLQGPARRLLLRRSKEPVPASGTLVVGDEFFGARSVDAPMAQAAPGGTAIAVGGSADPDMDALVWPRTGPAAAREIAEALAYQGDVKAEAMDVKAVVGWLTQSTASILVFIFTSLIYPLIAMPVVGPARFATLMAIGPFASIATGPLNGKIVDKMTIRNGMALNAVLRGVLVLDVAVFLTLGILNFWTLAAGAIANGWMLSMIMTTENAYLKGIGGPKNAPTLFAVGQVRYLSLQALLNLILGAGALVDMLMHPLSLQAWPHLARFLAPVWGPRLPFIVASLTNFLVVLPICLWLMPNKHVTYRETGEQEPPSLALSQTLRKAASAVKAAARAFCRPGAWRRRLEAAKAAVAGRRGAIARLAAAALVFGLAQWSPAFAAAPAHALMAHASAPAARALSAAYELVHTPLLVTAALLGLIRSSDAAQPVLSHKPLRNVILLISFGAGALVLGMQYVGFPLIAKGVAGAAAAGLMLGKLLGAFFFGQLLAYASQADLPKARVPLVGRIRAQRFVQAGALALTGVWAYHGLFPGHLLYAAGTAAAGAGLMAAGRRFTQKGLIALLGCGLLAGLGLMTLFHPVFLLLGAVAMGFSYGAGNNALYKYFYGSVPKGVAMGQAMGVQGSFFNGALSLGYGILSLMALKWAFPAMFLPMGALFAASAALFLLAPKLLPGLTGPLFKKRLK